MRAASVIALLGALNLGAKPPVVTMVELKIRSLNLHGQPVSKTVRVAHPKGWEGDVDEDGRSVRLFGPDGEGEIIVAAVGHPSELGQYLEDLRQRHPGATPSPPSHVKIQGIDPQRGERATRFEITGAEVGEMIMIERGEIIVLFAAIVAKGAWPEVKAQLDRCYPTVQVSDRAKPK